MRIIINLTKLHKETLYKKKSYAIKKYIIIYIIFNWLAIDKFL